MYFSEDLLTELVTDLTTSFGDNCAAYTESAVSYLSALHDEYCPVGIPPETDTCCVECVKKCLQELGSTTGIYLPSDNTCG